MRKLSKTLSIAIIFILLFSYSSMVYAIELEDVAVNREFTEEFKEYINLPKEEQEKLLVPKSFKLTDTKKQTKNPFKLATMLGENLESKYSLVDTIPENVIVKNQKKSQICWAFSSLSSLETNLALKNYRNSVKAKKYDFSESHMDYSLVRNFLNNKINEKGVNRAPLSPGNWFMALGYLTDGSGAISEEQMPFSDRGNTIDISEINNKNVITEVYDTKDFPVYTINDDLTELKKEMKSSIKIYGSIYSAIYGAQIISDYYNVSTGAIYCDSEKDCPVNHAVSIVGWDDNYDKNNFNKLHRPKNNGAWIIKNSWGSKYEVTLDEMRRAAFITYSEECEKAGFADANSVSIEFLKKVYEPTGFIFEENSAYIPVGNDGFMYVSYEDVNIYSELHLIEKASDKKTYDNVYNYDENGVVVVLPLATSKIYLANVFSKQNVNEEEYIDSIGIYAPETYTCKVYINPNGADKSKANMQLATLKTGESETFGAGFHTIELSEPIKITGEKFVVAIEIQGTMKNYITFGGEANLPNSPFDCVKLESEKCYIGLEDNFVNKSWIDLSKLTQHLPDYCNIDTSIKVYTTKTAKATSKLNEIKITTPPQKTTYTEGENFDKTGMVVKAYYSDGNSKEIKDYDILNGTNLKASQTEIKISYNGKEAIQKIKVNKKSNETPEKPTDSTDNNPLNADFSNAKCNVKKLKAHVDSNMQDISIDVEVVDINRKVGNDSYSYSYYLSANPNENNIEDWITIKEVQNDNAKLTFTINAADIKNYESLLSEENIYLYIKEVVTKGGNQKVTVSNSMKLSIENADEIDIKFDIGDINFNFSTEDNSQTPTQTVQINSNGDQTTASKVLPKTGIKEIATVAIIIAIFGVVYYIKYRKINNDLNNK